MEREGGGKRRRKEVEEEEGRSESIILHLADDVFFAEIYCRLGPRERGRLSCVNKSLAEANRRLDVDTKFYSFLSSRRRECGLARLPSWIVFIQDVSTTGGGGVQRSQYACQYFFTHNSRTGGRRQLFNGDHSHSHSMGRRAVRGTEHLWQGVGSRVIVASAEVGEEGLGFVGELESRVSWRWVPTLPEPGDIRPYDEWAPLRPVVTRVQFLWVGHRLVKLQLLNCLHYARQLARGSCYDAHSNRWSYITPLSKPREAVAALVDEDDPEEVEGAMLCFVLPWLAFQWKNRLYASARFSSETFVCNYDFLTRSWSGWNSTPDLVLLSRVLVNLPLRDRWYSLDLVGASDGTLFAAGIDEFGKIKVFFMREDATARRGFVWENVPIPRPSCGKDAPKYVYCFVCPLEANGSVAIISGIHGRHVEEAVWWFLTKFGVYESGTFRGYFPDFVTYGYDGQVAFALIHTDGI